MMKPKPAQFWRLSISVADDHPALKTLPSLRQSVVADKIKLIVKSRPER